MPSTDESGDRVETPRLIADPSVAGGHPQPSRYPVPSYRATLS
jgi:hypothetical protein